MPKTEWTQDTMAYAMCFFPLVGVIIGVATWFWGQACISFNLSWVVYAMGMTALPIIISGGIHLDGFCDTVDALSSHQSKERKLEILKDPHIGAFGTMACVIYILALFSFHAEFGMRDPIVSIMPSVIYIISRSFSGLSVVSFKSAKSDGTLATFAGKAQKRVVQITLCIYLVLCFLMFADWNMVLFIIMAITALAVFIYYKIMSYKHFGGITGDLAGYFLCLCELFLLITLCLSIRFF